MKTSYYHEPVLTYKETFYEKDGTNKLNIHNGSKSQYQWVLQGKIEDILWTIGTLKSKVRDIGVYTESACIKNLPAILGSRYRKIWDNLEKRRASSGDPALGTLTFKEATTEFLEDKAKDDTYKDTVLATFYDERTYTEPEGVSVEDHELRISQLYDYIDWLPGIHTGYLSDEERKNIFHNTFPKKWNLEFQNSHSVKNSSIRDIESWVIQHKRSQDKERKKKDHNNNKNKDKEKYAHKKNNGSSNGVWKVHGGHKWKKCKLNPRSVNFDEILYQNYKANRGYNNNRCGRGWRGRFGGHGRFGGRGGHGGVRNNYQSNYQHQP